MRVRNLFLEGLLVAVVGALLAFGVNAFSPRGLNLTRNYFPPPRAPALPASSARPAAGVANPASAQNELEVRLRAQGLALVESNRVVQLFRDPRRGQELIIFVDARSDEPYTAGHIPGAYQLDRYRPENYLEAVLSACGAAQQIVVYCNGGTCEDSEFAAELLQTAGVPAEKLLVYGGGISEWTQMGMPVELGARASGQIREAGALLTPESKGIGK